MDATPMMDREARSPEAPPAFRTPAPIEPNRPRSSALNASEIWFSGGRKRSMVVAWRLQPAWFGFDQRSPSRYQDPSISRQWQSGATIMRSNTSPRTYNQVEVPRPYTPGKRRFSIY